MSHSFATRAVSPGKPDRNSPARANRRSGQTVILATLTLTTMFGTVGLAVDLGWGYFLKQRVQTAADAAASAAAIYALNNADTCATVSCGTTLNCTGVTSPATTSLQAGCLYATVDGPPILSASMIENDSAHLPAGLTNVAPTIWVKATVSASNANKFLSLVGFNTASISASSIAGVSGAPAAACIYALDPTASGALQVKGTATLTVTNCPVYVNSNSPTAMKKTGSGDVNATVNIVGNYSQVGSGNITPAPFTGKMPVADPLAALPAPTFSGCDYTNFSASTSVTLNHGVYCGGISITGSGTTTMNPGTYIMNGGGFSSAGSANITASHVMIYNTASAGYSAGAVSIAGSGNFIMSAPNAGVYEGILIFQDRSLANAATVNGSSSSAVTGTLYFYDANLTYTGSSTAQYTGIVADTITMVGSSVIKNDTTGTYTGLSIAKASLLQ